MSDKEASCLLFVIFKDRLLIGLPSLNVDPMVAMVMPNGGVTASAVLVYSCGEAVCILEIHRVVDVCIKRSCTNAIQPMACHICLNMTSGTLCVDAVAIQKILAMSIMGDEVLLCATH